MTTIAHYVDGRPQAPLSGGYLDNIEPATGKVYSRVADGDAADVEAAVAAAERAFPAWSKMPAGDRSRILLRIAEMIEADLEKLALAESIDTGKPLTLARTMDIPRAAANFRFFATGILHFASEAHVTDEQALNYTLREPRGVVGLISPWNLPLYLLTWKVAPALATGNTAVAKPSELTPMTAHLLGEICTRAGLPAGVLNIVHGLGAKVGAAISTHPKIGTISFTGGTVTGRAIATAAAPMFKKVALEMGGKNPNIVFADADMDVAVPMCVRAAFANQGEICLCGSRIYVERAAYAGFVERFVAAAKGLKVGDPLEATTDQGALISAGHREKVEGYVEIARKDGGKILCGGRQPAGLAERCKGGFFYEPTVITDLPATCRVLREEVFGPVATIVPFEGEREAIDLANGTDYGLAAIVWTQNLARGHAVARAVQSGTVWVNCWLVRDLRVPFGGMKQSGVGREGGLEALRFFTEAKNVCVKIGQ